MRFIPFLLIVLLSALQVFLTWVWMKADLMKHFTAVFESFYGAAPAWSRFAFGLGWWWLACPLAACAWLLWVWLRQRQGARAWTVFLASLLVSLAMLYAMYPLHIMLAGGGV